MKLYSHQLMTKSFKETIGTTFSRYEIDNLLGI